MAKLDYREIPLGGRTLKALNLYKGRSFDKLLDAGCSYGYGVSHFGIVAEELHGIDPQKEAIEVAKERYPNISFKVGYLEEIPHDDSFFDSVICLDVIEHVKSETNSFDELYRVLRVGGELIVSVPHRSIFTFLDHENYTVFFRERFPNLYDGLYRFLRNKDPDSVAIGMEDWHRHYTVAELLEIINSSNFNNSFELLNIERNGFVFMPLASTFRFFGNALIGKSATKIVNYPLAWLSKNEYNLSFGRFAWCLMIRLKKTK